MMEKHILTIITQMSLGPSMNYFILFCLHRIRVFHGTLFWYSRRRSLTSDFDETRQWVCFNSRDTPIPLAKWVHSMLVLWGVLLVATVTDPTSTPLRRRIRRDSIWSLGSLRRSSVGTEAFFAGKVFFGQKTCGFCCMNMQHSRKHIIYIYIYLIYIYIYMHIYIQYVCEIFIESHHYRLLEKSIGFGPQNHVIR